MATRSQTYESYLNSFAWYLKRRAALQRAEEQCQRCGTQTGLEVHHLTYERLGDERENDLLVVCRACHVKEDQKRAAETQHNAARRLYEARLDGWATKKYGEGWSLYENIEYVEEEFDEWLERHEE